VLSCVLTAKECNAAMNLQWDFVQETSFGRVSRQDPTSWYPSSQDDDPWPCATDNKALFQTLGAGWLLRDLRELLADRVFAPLFQTDELISSKEGFCFPRPLREGQQQCRVSDQQVVESVVGEQRYDPTHALLHTIQSLTALEDQTEEDGDSCFYCTSTVFPNRSTARDPAASTTPRLAPVSLYRAGNRRRCPAGRSLCRQLSGRPSSITLQTLRRRVGILDNVGRRRNDERPRQVLGGHGIGLWTVRFRSSGGSPPRSSDSHKNGDDGLDRTRVCGKLQMAPRCHRSAESGVSGRCLSCVAEQCTVPLKN
jgi:hypothetical protein